MTAAPPRQTTAREGDVPGGQMWRGQYLTSLLSAGKLFCGSYENLFRSSCTDLYNRRISMDHRYAVGMEFKLQLLLAKMSQTRHRFKMSFPGTHISGYCCGGESG